MPPGSWWPWRRKRAPLIVEETKPEPDLTVSLWDEDFEIAHRCPECGGPVEHTGTCHTYGWKEDGSGGLACIGCWSAIRLYCVYDYGPDEDRGCGWEYTWGLNPKNPRSKENDKCRPSWIPVGARWDGGWPAQ